MTQSKKIQFIVSLTICLLGGCSKCHTLEEVDKKSTFHFMPKGQWIQTPSGRVSSGGEGTIFTQKDFALFGAMTHNDLYDGGLHHFNWMYKAKIANDGTASSPSWSYKATPDCYYFEFWKNDAMHSFFAIAPYGAISSSNVYGAPSVVLSPSTIAKKGVVSISNFSVPTEKLKEGYDLMYAAAANLEGSTSTATGGKDWSEHPNGNVELKFHHALSQVQFDFMLHPDMHAGFADEVKINAIRFTGMKKTGTLSFDNAGASATMEATGGNYDVSWGGKGEGIFDDAVWGAGRHAATETLSPIPHTDADGTYLALIMPQKFKAESAAAIEVDVYSRDAGGVFTIRKPLSDIAELSANGFVQGTRYKFTLTILTSDEMKAITDIELNTWEEIKGGLDL